MTDAVFMVCAGVIGLLVGSFLNVCIYRLPKHETVLWGRSRCLTCGRQIRAWENVPVLSFVLLRGKCAGCGTSLSWQYPIVELVTAVTFAGYAWLFGPTLLLVSRLIFAAAMIVLFTVDLNERLLPNAITLPGILVGLGFSIVLPPGFRDALIGTIACSLALWGMGEVMGRLMGKEALGFGDVKMVGMMGAFLGWQLTLVSLFLASSLGSVIGLTIVGITRNRDYMLPLGSFLAVGGLAAAAFGDPLIAWYVGSLLGR
jgi:leader peptidase (prepilin peptidase) / N-methyltransferase